MFLDRAQRDYQSCGDLLIGGALRSAATYPQASSGESIWRRADAGAHWSRVYPFPDQKVVIVAFDAVDTGGAHPTLLAAAGLGTTAQKLFSVATWQFSILPSAPFVRGALWPLFEGCPFPEPARYHGVRRLPSLDAFAIPRLRP